MAVPVNDLCVNAIDIDPTSLPLTIVVDTTEATDDPGDDCFGNGYNGVWYKITIPSDWHRLTITSNDPDDLGQVITMLGGVCGAFTDTFDCIAYDSESTDDVTPGVTYYFLLTSADPGGLAAFSWSLSRAQPSGDVCVDVDCSVPLEVSCPPQTTGSVGTPYSGYVTATGGTP